MTSVAPLGGDPDSVDASTLALIKAMQTVLTEQGFVRVIRRIMVAAKDLLHAEAASVFLVNRKRRRLEMAASTNLPASMERRIHFPLGIGVAGWVAQAGESVRVADIRRDPRHYRGVARKTGVETRGYLCVPLKVDSQILGTLQVLNHTSGGSFSEEDQHLLEGFAAIASLAMKKSQMHEVALEKKRIQSELAVAKAFQARMLPKQFAPHKGYCIAAMNSPARQMGGDIYDGFQLSDGYCVLVGDVSGKGPGAALWMASLSSLLHFLARQGRDPLAELQTINRHLSDIMPSGTFITMFLGCLYNGVLRYASAGHNPMLLYRSPGTAEWLPSTGLPLGVLPDCQCAFRERPFNAGDRLVLFTDGVTEAENRRGDMYGDTRLERAVSRHGAESPDHIVRGLYRSVRRFAGGREQSDDITILVVARE
jgi:sigma-B regulation protein RsbU (phosphoserine phosphatase)